MTAVTVAERLYENATQQATYLRYALNNLVEAQSYGSSSDLDDVTDSVVTMLATGLADRRRAERELRDARAKDRADREQADLDALRDKLTSPAKSDDFDLDEYGA